MNPRTGKPEVHSPSQGNGSALGLVLLMPGSVTRPAGGGCYGHEIKPLLHQTLPWTDQGKPLHRGD